MSADGGYGHVIPQKKVDPQAIKDEWQECVIQSKRGLHHRTLMEGIGIPLLGCGTGLVLALVVMILWGVYSENVTDVDVGGGDHAVFAILLVCALTLPCIAACCMHEDVAVVACELPMGIPVEEAGDKDKRPTNVTPPYMNSRVTGLVDGIDNKITLRDLWERNVARFGNRKAMGFRRTLHTVRQREDIPQKDGTVRSKVLTRVVKENKFHWLTFRECDELIIPASRCIRHMVDSNAPEVEGDGEEAPKHSGIYANTSHFWQMTSQACFRAGVPMATVYATLGVDGLAYACDMTRMTVLFCEKSTLKAVTQIAGGHTIVGGGDDGSDVACNLTSIKAVVVLDADNTKPGEGLEDWVTDADMAKLTEREDEAGGAIEVLTFNDMIARGRTITEGEAPAEGAAGAAGDESPEAGKGEGDGKQEETTVVITPPEPNDTAVIMFTSGSTGLPKGVEILHRNLCAGAAGIGGQVPALGQFPVKDGATEKEKDYDIYIGYLPLAHVLELVAELAMLGHGAAIGYGHPFTLTDSSPMVMLKKHDKENRYLKDVGGLMKGDAPLLAPTVMAGVPAVFDKVRKGILTRVRGEGAVKSALVGQAIATKTDCVLRGMDTPFWDRLVFDTVRKNALGGRVRLAVSGGGPISQETQIFTRVLFCCPVGQGYGLTETCGGGTLQWPTDTAAGRIGAPILSNYMRLEDWAEGGYSVQPNEKSQLPQGEIHIAGGNVTAGYYLMPEKTAAEFKPDYEGGRVWFRTGDIGQVDEDGVFSIIDRKKDLAKLKNGEYIALGKIESLAKLCPAVIHLVMFANSEHDYAVAVAVVSKADLPEPLCNLADEDLVGNQQAANEIINQLKALGKLSRSETPTRITVVGTEEWRPETDLVTASLKYQRRKIYDRFKDEFDAMYR